MGVHVRTCVLQDFVAQFKVHMFAEMLVQGNMLPEVGGVLFLLVL